MQITLECTALILSANLKVNDSRHCHPLIGHLGYISNGLFKFQHRMHTPVLINLFFCHGFDISLSLSGSTLMVANLNISRQSNGSEWS